MEVTFFHMREDILRKKDLNKKNTHYLLDDKNKEHRNFWGVPKLEA